MKKTKPIDSEERLGNMLRLLDVKFKHGARIDGKEVDYLIKRLGKKDLIIEADGDIYHMNIEKRDIRDKLLKKAGFDIIHIWGSEIVNTPEMVYADLAKTFGISNPPSIFKKKKSRKAKKKKKNIQTSKSPDSPRKKEYRI